MKQGNFITKVSSNIEGHDHEILIGWQKKNNGFYIASCDSDKGAWILAKKCFDRHEAMMTITGDQ